MVAVYDANHTKPMNTACEQNIVIVLKQMVHIVTTKGSCPWDSVTDKFNCIYMDLRELYWGHGKKSVDGGDDGARGFALWAYCCIPLHTPLTCVKKPKVLVTSEGYLYQHSHGHNGCTTGGKYRKIWRGKYNHSKEPWRGESSLHDFRIVDDLVRWMILISVSLNIRFCHQIFVFDIDWVIQI
jgi:hypothetical protein